MSSGRVESLGGLVDEAYYCRGGLADHARRGPVNIVLMWAS